MELGRIITERLGYNQIQINTHRHEGAISRGWLPAPVLLLVAVLVGWGLLYANQYVKGCAQDWDEGSGAGSRGT